MSTVDCGRSMSIYVDYGRRNSQINHQYVYYHWCKLQGIWMYFRFIVNIPKKTFHFFFIFYVDGRLRSIYVDLCRL